MPNELGAETPPTFVAKGSRNKQNFIGDTSASHRRSSGYIIIHGIITFSENV